MPPVPASECVCLNAFLHHGIYKFHETNKFPLFHASVFLLFPCFPCVLGIQSLAWCMGPLCFLLCLIQHLKGQSLHFKLHAFSPFFSLPCSLSHLYVYASSAYSNALQSCVWMKGLAELPALPTVEFPTMNATCPTSPLINTKLTNTPFAIYLLSTFYERCVNNWREMYDGVEDCPSIWIYVVCICVGEYGF